MSMRLIYLANQRIPTEKAYGIQIAKMCEAFADAGLDVTLAAPRRGKGIIPDPFDYYSLRRNFKVKYLNPPDFYWPGKLDFLAFWIKNFFSAWVLARHALKTKPDIIYSRDELPLYFLSFFKGAENLFFEIHRFSKSKSWFLRRFRKLGIKVIAISGGIKNELIKFGFPEQNILVAHDGVDLAQFDLKLPTDESRGKLNLPPGFLIGYVGQFKTMGVEKGVYTAIEALEFLPSDAKLALVGGREEEIKEYRNFASRLDVASRVIFVSKVSHSLVPFYLKACDVLIAPFPNTEHFAQYMSPLKLFEYMASAKPIVVSNLPTIREILGEEDAVFVQPGKPNSLSEGIRAVMDNQELAKKIAHNSFVKVQNYSWWARTQSITSFLNPDSAISKAKEMVRKSIKGRVIAVAAGALLALFFAELGLRLLGYPASDIYRRDGATALLTLRPDSSIYFNGGCFRNTIKTNSLGFHSKEYAKEKGKDTFRIIVVGDSFTEAIHVPLEKMFVSILEEKLNNQPKPRYKYEVIPFGISSHGTYGNLLYLVNYGLKFKPDLVINAMATNDPEDDMFGKSDPALKFDEVGDPVLNLSASSPPPFYDKIKTSAKYLARKSVLFTFARKKLLEFRAQKFGIENSALEMLDFENETWKLQEKLLLTMRDIARENKAGFLLVSLTDGHRVHRDLMEDFKKQLGETSKSWGMDKLEKKLAAISLKNKIPYLPLNPLFYKMAPKKKDKTVWPCDGHWNETGHRWAAEAIFEFLISRQDLIRR